MKRKLLIALALAVLFFSFYGARPNYFVLVPGSAEDMKRFVEVPEASDGDEGTFYLVTVAQYRANWPLFFSGLVNPVVDLIPMERAIPPGMDPEEYRELMRQWMEESQLLAKTLALRRAGYTVPVESDGVLIVEVLATSPARDTLQGGDVIKAVDGRQVMLTEELIQLVQAREAGETVEVTFEREGQLRREVVGTAEHPEQAGKAALQVMVRTLNWQPVLPVDIKIQTGGITGPSAGLMFVLEILNQLDPADITRGRRIAGTGTVNINEEVGPIGGVKQKVAAAEKAGAEFFLVPEENLEDARGIATEITVVPVRTLQEALDFLNSLTAANPSREGFFLWALTGGAGVIAAPGAV